MTRPDINSEFGTSTFWLSSVSISVARIRILRTNPSTSPTVTKSPVRIGRSNNKIMPETKLFAISCMPKPMPRARAPEMSAMPVRSTSAIANATSTAMTKPMYPNNVMMASRAPRSATMCCNQRRSIQRLSQPITMMTPAKTRMPPIILSGIICTLPIGQPTLTFSTSLPSVEPDSSQT